MKKAPPKKPTSAHLKKRGEKMMAGVRQQQEAKENSERKQHLHQIPQEMQAIAELKSAIINLQKKYSPSDQESLSFLNQLLHFLEARCTKLINPTTLESETSLSGSQSVWHSLKNLFKQDQELAAVVLSAIDLGLLYPLQDSEDNMNFEKDWIEALRLKLLNAILSKETEVEVETKNKPAELKAKKQVRFPTDEKIAEYAEVAVVATEQTEERESQKSKKKADSAQVNADQESKSKEKADQVEEYIDRKEATAPIPTGGRRIFLMPHFEKVNKRVLKSYVFSQNPPTLCYVSRSGKISLLTIPKDKEQVIKKAKISNPLVRINYTHSAAEVEQFIEIIESNPEHKPTTTEPKEEKEKSVADKLINIINSHSRIARTTIRETERDFFRRVEQSNAIIAEAVKNLLQEIKTPDLNQTDKNGKLPLIEAIKQKNTAVVQLFLSHGANPDLTDSQGTIAILEAAKAQAYEIFDLLSKNKPDRLQQTDAQGKNILMLLTAAAGEGDVDKNLVYINGLLAAKSLAIDSQDAEGNTALSIAAKKGYDLLIPLFIKHQARDIPIKNGKTALMLLIENNRDNQSDMVLALLDGKPATSDVNHQNPAGETALSLAIKKGATKCVNILLDYQANPNPGLLAAVAMGRNDIIKRLLNERADVNYRNAAGETALMLAAKNGSYSAVDILLTAGADPTLTNNAGKTALQLASEKGDTKVVNHLSSFLSRNKWKFFGIAIFTGVGIALTATGVFAPLGIAALGLAYLAGGGMGFGAGLLSFGSKMVYDERQLSQERHAALDHPPLAKLPAAVVKPAEGQIETKESKHAQPSQPPLPAADSAHPEIKQQRTKEGDSLARPATAAAETKERKFDSSASSSEHDDSDDSKERPPSPSTQVVIAVKKLEQSGQSLVTGDAHAQRLVARIVTAEASAVSSSSLANSATDGSTKGKQLDQSIADPQDPSPDSNLTAS